MGSDIWYDVTSILGIMGHLMQAVRRTEKLNFANTCGGERFPMYLGGRCFRQRWNNPRLFRKDQPFKDRVPVFVDVFLAERPVKRIYRGFLTSGRYSRMQFSDRPTVETGSSFLQTFEWVAERIGRAPEPLSLANLEYRLGVK